MRPFHHPSLFQCLLGTATVQFDYHSGQYLFGSYFGISLTNAAYDYVVVGGGTGGGVGRRQLSRPGQAVEVEYGCVCVK